MKYTTSNFEEIVLITIGICGQVDRRTFMDDLTKEPYCYKKATVKSLISSMEKKGLIITYTPREEINDKTILARDKTKLLRLSYPKGDERVNNILPDLYFQFRNMSGEKRFGENKRERKRQEEISKLAYTNLSNGIPVDFNQIKYVKSDFENRTSIECKILSDDFKEAFNQMETDEVNYFTKPTIKNISLVPVGTYANVGSCFPGILTKKPNVYICYYQSDKNKKWNSVEKVTKYAIYRKLAGAIKNVPQAILYVKNMEVFENVLCEPPKETAKTGELSRYYDEGTFVVPMERFREMTTLILNDNEEEIIKSIPELEGKEVESVLKCDIAHMKKIKKTTKPIVCYEWQLETMKRYFNKSEKSFYVIQS